MSEAVASRRTARFEPAVVGMGLVLVSLGAWDAAAEFVRTDSGERLRLAMASAVIGTPLAFAAAFTFLRLLRGARLAPPVWAALAAVGGIHLLFLIGMFPGLIVSDAAHVYALGVRGSIDDGYGYLWPLLLRAALGIFRSPATMGVLQLLYFAGLLFYLARALSARGVPPGRIAACILLLGFFPAVLISVTYQHRDVVVALVSLNWALVMLMGAPQLLRGDADAYRRALVLQAALLLVLGLLRTDAVPGAWLVLGAIGLARVRLLGGVRQLIAPLIAAVAVTGAAAGYSFVVQRIVDVQYRPTPYLVTLLVQPVGHILSRAGNAAIQPGFMAATERLFDPQALAQLATPQNIFIVWTPHLRHPADPSAYQDFYRHAFRLIVDNLPAALANRLEVYLHGNGIGHLPEPHQDQARTPGFANKTGFEGVHFGPPALASAASRFVGWTLGTGFQSAQRALFWNTLPFVIVAVVLLLRSSPTRASWLIALVLAFRAFVLFVAAPSAQLAYHLPVLMLGLALLVALACARYLEAA